MLKNITFSNKNRHVIKKYKLLKFIKYYYTSQQIIFQVRYIKV